MNSSKIWEKVRIFSKIQKTQFFKNKKKNHKRYYRKRTAIMGLCQIKVGVGMRKPQKVGSWLGKPINKKKGHKIQRAPTSRWNL